jgi:DNA polymerase III alpha subunit
LIALSGCLASEIPELIVKDQLDKARETIDWFKQTLGAENFYLELQNHGIADQVKVNRHLIPWAREFGLKLVATNDVHYVAKEHSHAHDCLICIGTQTLLSDTKRMRYQPQQFYLRSAEEMKARFAETPEAVRNTLEVAEKCNLEIQFNKLHYPVFHPPEKQTRESYLRQWLAEGLAERYSIRARSTGNGFAVDGIDDPRKLPNVAARRGRARRGGNRRRRQGRHGPVGDRVEGHREDRVHQLLPDRRRFCPLRPEQGRGVRGARLGRRLDCHLFAGNFQRGPDSLRPALRAVPQSRARQSAGH